MLPQFLVPETVVHENGASAALAIGDSQTLQLTLTIQSIVEQESIELHIEGSVDGETWMDKPLAFFPQKFYEGSSSILCDLRPHAGVKAIRATWKVNRWGRGDLTPRFGFYLFVEGLSLGVRTVPV